MGTVKFFSRKLRFYIQLIAAIIFNGYLVGFFRGKIFTGKSKLVCLPVLNCYSCPGALGACPIGAMQAVNGDAKRSFSFYVFGLMMLFGVLFGRLICVFFCPFGFIQDILHKIKSPKFDVPVKIDKPMRLIKYLMLIGVFLLPVILVNPYGIGSPYFCKFICPAGTLEAGIPLILTNASLRGIIGGLFAWKMGILVAIVVASILIYRPFCKYLCPLGAFYALFNKTGFYRMRVDKNKCTNCMECERACKMNVEVRKNINSTECIRCKQCESVCDYDAISSRFLFIKNKEYES